MYSPAIMSDSWTSDCGAPGTVVLRDAATARWLLFRRPIRALAARSLDEVQPLLREVEAAAARRQHAAGFLSYEAAPAFDTAFRARPAGPAPMAWFGLYREPEVVALPDPQPVAPETTAWEPDTARADYLAAIGRIRDYIATGDTYQVNYTFRLRARLREDPWKLFLRLQHAQQAPYGAFVNAGDDTICSASPELFFDMRGSRIECRPMKGTRPRGLRIDDDRALGADLAAARKDRAENVMIVDMVRNDLGRVCKHGTVETVSLFDVERYPTLWQMTSTVRGESGAPLTDIFKALFPCASITGAPKIRTMQIIDELERSPRGVYTGCIGFVAPNRRAQFSVAIRTAHLRGGGAAEYGTGGGIVWDSSPEGEYEECLTKAAILGESPRRFQLLETMRWDVWRGFLFLDEHIRRMGESAAYFGFAFDAEAVRQRLVSEAAGFGDGGRRVRVLASDDGQVNVEAAALADAFHDEPDDRAPAWRVGLARTPVPSRLRFLYHKTTRREAYERARREAGGADDALLWNERGEVTESTIANVVAVLDGEWVTPPLACGLLGGVFREHLLRTGRVRERTLRVGDLPRASAVYLVNSVRGWIRAACSTRV